MEWNKEELGKILLEVKKKAMTDTAFRRVCLSDAAAAIKEIAGKELPESVRLKFVENGGAGVTIVLPDMINAEMSEKDLDQVAGGISIFTVWGCPTENAMYC